MYDGPLMEVIEDTKYLNLRYDVSCWRAAACVFHWRQYGADDLGVTQIVDDADNKLFRDILSNPHHTLHHLVPKQTTHKHQLRTRRHDRQLLCKSKFDDNNFISRLLYKDCY